MTLLTICQDASDELQIAPRPQAIIGSTGTGERRLLRYAQKTGRQLMRSFAWQKLRKEQTFTALAASLQTSILPSDFDRFVPESFWDRTNDRLVVGPVDAVRWQALSARSYTGTARRFIYRGSAVYVLPAFGGGESLAFEYVSSHFCESSGGTGQTAWTADTDVGRVDEELVTQGVIYRYLMSEGLPYGEALAVFRQMRRELTGNDEAIMPILSAGDIFSGGRHTTGEPSLGEEDWA